jgi:hypothetical protein
MPPKLANYPSTQMVFHHAPLPVSSPVQACALKSFRLSTKNYELTRPQSGFVPHPSEQIRYPLRYLIGSDSLTSSPQDSIPPPLNGNYSWCHGSGLCSDSSASMRLPSSTILISTTLPYSRRLAFFHGRQPSTGSNPVVHEVVTLRFSHQLVLQPSPVLIRSPTSSSVFTSASLRYFELNPPGSAPFESRNTRFVGE